MSEIVPGFGVGGEWNRDDLAQRLIDLWLRDAGAAADLAALPWVEDGISGWDNLGLISLVEVAATNVELGRRVAGFPWIRSSVGEVEARWLQGLGGIASHDPDLANTAASLPWSNIDQEGYGSLITLANIASTDLELARAVAELPWLLDGVTKDEAITLFYLEQIVSTDREFASTVIDLPWFNIRETAGEWDIVQRLGLIAENDLALAQWLSGFPISEGLGNHMLRAFYLLAANEPDLVSRIIGLPWVQDGLDQSEMAFLVALVGEAEDTTYGNPAFFEDLLKDHYTQSKTLSLPLAGKVNIWVFQSVPFSSGEDIPTIIDDALRTIEGFMGDPLPNTDIVALIENLSPEQAPPTAGFNPVVGLHRRDHIRVNRRHGEDLEHVVSTIVHELAHYYRFTPSWFNESFAHLMEGYVVWKLGIRSMAQAKAEVSDRVHRQCSREDIATISQSVFLDRFRFVNAGYCTRSIGTNFLHHSFEIMGEDRIAAALRDLSKLHETNDEAAEEAIFRSLWSNTPPERRGEFRDLYRRLHGGPYTHPDLDRSDDHGDRAEDATDVSVGQVISGEYDYLGDLDYFKFQAQGNQKYRFEVDHETLRVDDVMVLTSAGRRSLVKDRVRVSSGPLVQWVAPSTDSYYFAVLNWIGASGEYTLRITHVPDVPDDHGDNTTTATDVSLGTTVQGVIDDAFDLDYFRLPGIGAKQVSVTISGESLQNCCLGLNTPGDGRSGLLFGGGGAGDRYIVVHGGHENTGAYTLEIK